MEEISLDGDSEGISLDDMGFGDEGAPSGDMPDLDAIMNSLTTDDVSSLEEANNDKDDSDMNEDILSALTSEGDEESPESEAEPEEISIDDSGEAEPAIDDEDLAISDEISLDEGVENSEEGDLDSGLEDLGEDGEDDLDIPALEDIALEEDGLGEEEEEPKPKKKKGKKKKDAEDEDTDGEPKKKNPILAFFANLINVLTKEDEELEKSDADELASLTDDNQQVLDELAAEGGKKKKEKKKKEKKEKPKKEKKEKKPKEPKPKKEKKPKEPKDPGVPEKAIAPKKVAVSGIFAVSLGILFALPAIIMPEKIAITRAETAYYLKDYPTSYKLLYGKNLTEEQSLIYNQSRVITWANHYLNSYYNYKDMHMEEEALDSLLKAMAQYGTITADAEQFLVENEVNSVYDSIESLLETEYGLSVEDAEAINSIESKYDYTVKVMQIVGSL